MSEHTDTRRLKKRLATILNSPGSERKKLPSYTKQKRNTRRLRAIIGMEWLCAYNTIFDKNIPMIILESQGEKDLDDGEDDSIIKNIANYLMACGYLSSIDDSPYVLVDRILTIKLVTKMANELSERTLDVIGDVIHGVDVLDYRLMRWMMYKSYTDGLFDLVIEDR